MAKRTAQGVSRLPAIRHRYRWEKGAFHSYLAVKHLPSALPEFFISGLLRRYRYVSVSVSTYPLSRASSLSRIDRALTRCGAEIAYRSDTGRHILHLTQFQARLEELKQEILSDSLMLFDASIIFRVSAFRLDELASRVEALESELRSDGIGIYSGKYRQDELHTAFLPGKPCFPVVVLVSDRTLPALIPFTQTPLMDRDGAYIGRDANDLSPVIIDRFKGSNFNSVIVGKSGSGKSFFAKLMLLRGKRSGNNYHFILDPLGEFEWVTHFVGGNYFDLMQFGIGIGNLTYSTDSELLAAVINLVCSPFRGIMGLAADLESRIRRKMAERPDAPLRLVLSSINSDLLAEGLHEAASLVERLLKGDLRFMLDGCWIFGSIGTVNAFDYSGMEESLRRAVSVFLLECILILCRRIDGRKSIFIDEAWKFAEDASIFSNLSKSMRHSRHYNTGIVLITQNLNDVILGSNGNIFNNASSAFIFAHERTEVKLSEALELNKNEMEFVNSNTPREARCSRSILLMPGRKIPLLHDSSEIEFSVCNSESSSVPSFHSFMASLALLSLNRLEYVAGGGIL